MITKGLADFQIRRQQKQSYFLRTNPCNKLFECYTRVSMVLFRALVIIYGLTKWGKCQSHTVYITYQGKSKLTQKKQGNGNATLNHSAVMPQKDNTR